MLNRNDAPQYALARRVLIWALISGMKDSNPLKAKIMQSFETNDGWFNDKVLTDYFEKNENLALVREAGKRMYKVAVDIIKQIP